MAQTKTARRDRSVENRRAKNLAIRQEEWRKGLKVANYLRQIEAIDRTLQTQWQTLDSEQIQALRLRADLNFKRLNKLLPDLKATDVTTGGDQIGNVGIAVIPQPPSTDAWIAAATVKTVGQKPKNTDCNDESSCKDLKHKER